MRIKVALLSQDQLCLDVRVEGTEHQTVRVETLTIEGNTVSERRIAQRGELVQRDIPQVNRSEFLTGQSHDISPCDSRYVNGVCAREALFTEACRSLGRHRH